MIVPSGKVLVADDDVAFLDLMCMHLEKNGFEISRALDGREAIEVLRTSGPFQVLVTDLMMPGMSGLELVRQGRKLDPDLEVIVITAAGSLDMAISAMRENGAFDYLTKPLDLISELSLAVERAVAHRKLRMEREALRARSGQSNGYLEAAMACAGDAVIAADQKGELLVLSPSARRLLHREGVHNPGRADDLPTPLPLLIKRWQSLDGSQPAQVQIHWPKGNFHQVILTPVPNRSGIEPGWAMLLRDQTYHHHLERLLVHNFARAAVTVRRSLEQSVRQIDDLTAGLRTGAVDANLELGKVRSLLTSSREAMQLSFALTDGVPGDDRELVDLAPYLERSARQVAASALREGEHNLCWNVPAQVPDLVVQRALFDQALRHLMKLASLTSGYKADIYFSAHERGDSFWLEVILPAFKQDLGYVNGSHAREGVKPINIERSLLNTVVGQLGGQIWERKANPGSTILSVCLASSA